MHGVMKSLAMSFFKMAHNARICAGVPACRKYKVKNKPRTNYDAGFFTLITHSKNYFLTLI